MKVSDEFLQNGYLPIVEVMSEQEMVPYRTEFDRLETEYGKQASQTGIFGKHRENVYIWEMATHPSLLDAVQWCMGSDVFLLGTAFFFKHPDFREGFVA